VHLSDGSLFALLDGELPPDAAAAALSHLRECPACQERREALERERREIADLVGQLDHAPPPVTVDMVVTRALHFGARRGLLAAGLATLLIGSAAVVFATAIPRQWLARVFHPHPASRAQEPSRASTTSTRSGVALVPGRTLILAFRAEQSSGSVRISFVSDSLVTVLALGDTVNYSVGTDAVTIGNDGRTTANYEIRVPQTLAHIRVRVGGRVIFTKNDSVVVSPVPRDGATGEYVIPIHFQPAAGRAQP
jgi:hypothetical protein